MSEQEALRREASTRSYLEEGEEAAAEAPKPQQAKATAIAQQLQQFLAVVPRPPSLKPSIDKPSLDRALPMPAPSHAATPVVPRAPSLWVRLERPAVDKSAPRPLPATQAVVVPKIPRLSVPSVHASVDCTIPTLEHAEGIQRVPEVSQLPTPGVLAYVDRSLPAQAESTQNASKAAVVHPQRVVSAPERAKAALKRVVSSALAAMFKRPGRYRLLLEELGASDALGLLEASPERPVVVVAVKPPSPELKYREALFSILRELARIKSGPPRPIAATAGREVGVVQDLHAASNVVKLVDDSEADFLRFSAKSGDKVDLGALRSRLMELSQVGLSFLVFYVGEEKAKQLLLYLWSLRADLGRAKLVVVRPRGAARELARLVWLSDKCFDESIDGCFSAGEKAFYDKLEKIARNPKYAVKPSEGESPLHYMLKAFLLHYFAKMGLRPEDVVAEEELGGVRPDIYVRPMGVAVEVETFYGTGVAPWAKLNETVEKYDVVKGSDLREVWLVVPPLQTALFLGGLVRLYRGWKRRGKRVKVFTVDVVHEELVPIEKYARRIAKAVLRAAERRSGQ